MLEYIILGIIQGIAEWLPVSSEGLIVLAKAHLFGGSGSLELMIQEALFLHLGTLLAAVIYFRQDVVTLVKSIFQYSSAGEETKRLFHFLFISTLISGALGIILLKVLTLYAGQFASTARFITFLVGCCLLGTAYLELRAKHGGYRETQDLKFKDSILLGIAQGFAALPGLSRSGLTVSTLLLIKFDKTHALKLSFLMSIPIVLAGNILLNLNELAVSVEALAGLFFSFIFGLATIHVLLKAARAINFGYFVLGFGILTIGSVFI